MARLAEYLSDLATMLGSPGNVHLMKLEKGSTVPVVLVDFEAKPKVRDRIRAVKNQEAPEDALTAAKDIDRRLLQDNAKAELRDPAGAKVFHFPGEKTQPDRSLAQSISPAVFKGFRSRSAAKTTLYLSHYGMEYALDEIVNTINQAVSTVRGAKTG